LAPLAPLAKRRATLPLATALLLADAPTN